MESPSKICDLSATFARMGNNVALVKQLADFCREDLPVYMDRLRQAVAAGDHGEVQHAAHSVKGLVVNFDAQPVVTAAIRLERMGQAKELTGAPEALQELEQQTTRLLEVLAAELAKY